MTYILKFGRLRRMYIISFLKESWFFINFIKDSSKVQLKEI